MQIQQKLSFDSVLDQHKPVAVVVLIFSLLASCFAAVFFRPEYADGGIFVYNAMNSGSPSPEIPNGRTLYEILYFPFYILRWLPNSDTWFLTQRLLVNIWIALVPVFLFAWGCLVLFWQKRSFLLPWMIMVLAICLHFGSGFHSNVATETILLVMVFYFLSSPASTHIHPVLYTLSLGFSAILVTGYEPPLLIYLLGISSVLWDLFRKRQSLRDWRTSLYLLVSVGMFLFLIYRFYLLNFKLHIGNLPEWGLIENNLSHFLRGFAAVGIFGFIGLGFFSTKKWFRKAWIGLFLLAFGFFLIVVLNYQERHFHEFNHAWRFERVFIFFGLGLVFLFFPQKKLIASVKPLFKWSLFMFLLFWLHDLQNTYAFFNTQQVRRRAEPDWPGCRIANGMVDSYSSILDQKTFRPTRAPMNCPFLGIPLSEYCQPVSSRRQGHPNTKCFEGAGIFPNRISFDLIFSPRPQAK